MSRSPCLFLTSVLALAGCPGGGETCGPGGAALDGLQLAGTGVDVRYTELGASPNADCPAVGAPDNVTSLTINGTQTGAAFAITLCVSRPDLIETQTQQLGTDVKIIGIGATLGGGCTLASSNAMPATGTVIGAGLCNNGRDPAGFALTFDGVVPMKRTCGANVDVLDLALTGTVAVAGPK
jgi:hypothetical protein